MTSFWRWGLGAAMAALLMTSVAGLVGLRNQKARADELAGTNLSLHDSLIQVQGQLQNLTARLESLTEQQRAAAAAAVPAARPRTQTARSAAAADSRLKQIQQNIATQQKQLEATRQDLAAAKQDLDSTRRDLAAARSDFDKANQEVNGRLDSTRDELSGSIARNHDELVALQKRGERNYYEFTIARNKQFQRVGPMSVSLRKTNFKHKYFDLTLMVDDQQIEKKHVNLYEPVMIRLSDRPQPVELVVNEIRDNQIKGYVSEPKYKNSELAKAQ